MPKNHTPDKRHQPLLTIAIPSYNVANFLEETVNSLIDQPHLDQLEILIINDGSKDKTLSVGKKLEKRHKPFVRLINKENGGHGSAINTGIRKATGKYFRLLDGDDYFNSSELSHLIELLVKESSDLIFTDLTEVFTQSGMYRPCRYYSHMQPGKQYVLKDIDFPTWGPMLSTSTVKTELLQTPPFTIDEHCYYVDQEYDLLIYLRAQTVTYHPLDIYRYRLEREGQSMQKSSLIKNVYSHEKVCLRLAKEFYDTKPNLSQGKIAYIYNRVIVPMCHMQYMITTEYINSPKPFQSFDRQLKAFPELYQDTNVAGKIVKLHRATNGNSIFADKPIKTIKKIIKR